MKPPFPPAHARLAPLRRIPFPAMAAALCLLFAAAGAAVLDDYGVGFDVRAQRQIAAFNADYIMGDRNAFPDHHDKFYGVAFELPLLMAERALGLQDWRDIFLLRHSLTHLFFIIGGFFCGLLVYRMFGSRWIALLAMLLFLLHPRLYAHSFFNSKDIPFMVIFMIALYLTHRAFQRNTIGAFALLGLIVGLAVNMRPFALLLPAAVLAMRCLDWYFAPNPQQRNKILVAGGIFAAAVVLAIYASHPYYWLNPLSYFEGLQTFSSHPTLSPNLFMGETILADAVPQEYIPVWFGITAPPIALLLGGAGVVKVLIWGVQRPGRALRNGRLRFTLLFLACFAAPIIAAAVWQFNIYNGWRHFYFLWSPFCLTAAGGLHWLAGNAGGGGGRKLLGCPNPVRQVGTYTLAGAGLTIAVATIISMHPHQYVYFNSLAHWGANESIGQRFDLDYWGISYRQGIEHILEKYPQSPLYIYALSGTNQFHDITRNSQILRDDDRKRLFFVEQSPDFYMANDWIANYYQNYAFVEMGNAPVVHTIKTRNSPFLTITAPGLSDITPSALANLYQTKYQDITANELAVDATFDVYMSGDGRTLYYAKTGCTTEDASGWFYLHIFPQDKRDLPDAGGEHGFENRDFAFKQQGGAVDDKCWAEAPLPDYPIALIRTGQTGPDGEPLWRAEINPSTQARFDEMEARLSTLERAVGGFFELYRNGNRLIYYRESCAADDTQARFFLHLFPADGNNLSEGRRGYGFNNLGFDFSEHGAHQGGKCLAEVALPAYETARIRTGQHTTGQEIWSAELPAAR